MRLGQVFAYRKMTPKTQNERMSEGYFPFLKLRNRRNICRMRGFSPEEPHRKIHPDVRAEFSELPRSLAAAGRYILRPVAIAFFCFAFLTACAASGPDAGELRDEAVNLYQAGDYEKAVDKFSEALDASKGQVSEFQYDILRYRAECELRIGDTDAAKAGYEALLELDSDAGNDARYREVLDELEKIEELESANELFEGGDYDKAAELYEGLSSAGTGICADLALYNLAVTKEYMGDFAGAARLFGEYLSVFPDDEEALREYEFTSSRASGPG